MNFALIVRLASEFQGYCRDLHEESIDHVVGNLSLTPGPGLYAILRGSFFTPKRQLDTGNPTWSTLCTDFKRIGLDLTILKQKHQARYSIWCETVENLLRARNAIAHANDQEINNCRQANPLTLATFRTWRGRVNRIAGNMDKLAEAELTSLTGVTPW
jgi:hypothetical protein